MLLNRLCMSIDNPAKNLWTRFALWPYAHTFPAGHRIAMTLSAVDAPTFKPDTEPAYTSIQSVTRVQLPIQP